MSHLYIQYVEGDRKFTLRKTVTSVSGVESNLHVEVLDAKLSASLVEAYDIAKELGLDLKYDPNNSFPPDIGAILQQKKSVRDAKRQVKEDRISAIDEARQVRRSGSEQLLEDGTYPFGKYVGHKIEDQPGYAQWLVEKQAEFPKGSILEYAVSVIERKFQHLLVKVEIYKPGHRPEAEGRRVHIQGTVIRRMAFAGGFGMMNMIFIKDVSGLCIVAKGSWNADVGDLVDVTANIKAKDNYKGQDQTVVNRVK